MVCEQNFFKIYIVPGGSIVKRIIKQENINENDYLVGVACRVELEDFSKHLSLVKGGKKNKVAVELSKAGCVNTQVELAKLLKLLEKQ